MPDSAVQSGRIASARNALAMAVQDLSPQSEMGQDIAAQVDVQLRAALQN